MRSLERRMGYGHSIRGPVPSVSYALCVERADMRVMGYARNGVPSGGGEQVVDDLEGNDGGVERYGMLREGWLEVLNAP